MKKNRSVLIILFVVTIFLTKFALSQEIQQLKIDPLLLVSYKECCNLADALGDDFYPNWNFKDTPVLFYKPDVQELLINYPHHPKGYSIYTGFHPLESKTIFVRNDTTFTSYDDQNTSRDIDGVQVLIVADPHSRMRNQLRAVFANQTKEFVNDWLDKWNFIPSPYNEIMIILHEAFHVFQKQQAPDKYASESVIAQYPLLDPVNNALSVLEGRILKDALTADNSDFKREKIKTFVAVRTYRQSRLKKELVEYENLNEYAEGTAKYLEYRFLKMAEKVDPIREMYYRHGFEGYGEVLRDQYNKRIEDMVNIVAVNDDRFGNKFGSGPLRWKLYELGACQAMLLDDVLPDWKNRIFDENIYIFDLLKQASNLSDSETEQYLNLAKSEYDYNSVYINKLEFQQEGKKFVKKKLDSILKTDQTLISINYDGYTDKLGMFYTPFGVTRIAEGSAIYDMIPIRIRFREGVSLKMKQITPVFIDKKKKIVQFTVKTPPTQFPDDLTQKLVTPEFTLENVEMKIVKNKNHVLIQFKE